MAVADQTPFAETATEVAVRPIVARGVQAQTGDETVGVWDSM